VLLGAPALLLVQPAFFENDKIVPANFSPYGSS